MVDETYVNWLNDDEVNRYLEVRFGIPHTLDSTKEFVKMNYEDASNHFFAIMLKKDDRHIGNIKVGPINKHHGFAEIGIMIGEKSAWGKGHGTEAIKLATQYSFEKLGVHKLIAGFYDVNMGSRKAFEKAGYSQEGVLTKKFRCEGRYVDHLLFCKNK